MSGRMAQLWGPHCAWPLVGTGWGGCGFGRNAVADPKGAAAGRCQLMALLPEGSLLKNILCVHLYGCHPATFHFMVKLHT